MRSHSVTPSTLARLIHPVLPPSFHLTLIQPAPPSSSIVPAFFLTPFTGDHSNVYVLPFVMNDGVVLSEHELVANAIAARAAKVMCFMSSTMVWVRRARHRINDRA